MTDIHNKPLKGLVQLLALENLDENHYLGQSYPIGSRQIYGGQLVAQALQALALYKSQMGLEDFLLQSCHSYFIRPGNHDYPISYTVTPLRQGKKFAAFCIHAHQKETLIFQMMASIHQEEPSPTHQKPMPIVPKPQTLAPWPQYLKELGDQLPAQALKFYSQPFPFDIRPITTKYLLGKGEEPAKRQYWLKAWDPLPYPQSFHKVILSYISDWGILSTSAQPLKINPWHPSVRMASLDHSLWFHKPICVDDWILFDIESDVFSDSRGLSRGSFYTQTGDLIATVVQEGLIRIHEP